MNKSLSKELTKKILKLIYLFLKSQLLAVSEEIIKENRGTGRAIAGGLLFGTAGAVVGAVTAKDKKKTIYYKVINYVSNNEERSIVLGTRGDINEMKFFRKLSELIPKKEMPSSIDL